MPFYDYECSGCALVFTLIRPMAERDEPADCPECGATANRQEVSAFSMGGPTGPSGGCGSGGFT